MCRVPRTYYEQIGLSNAKLDKMLDATKKVA